MDVGYEGEGVERWRGTQVGAGVDIWKVEDTWFDSFFLQGVREVEEAEDMS